MGNQRETVKKEIIQIFESRIKGRKAETSLSNQEHDGKEGDWLTKEMGLTTNGKNEPDFKGFEMKKDSPKTTFGDWSPDFAIYKKPNQIISRINFLKSFGRRSVVEKNNETFERYAWSGKIFPTVKGINKYGQQMVVTEDESVVIRYFYSKDQRQSKDLIVPTALQIDDLELVSWSKRKLKKNLEKKFNKLGWFKCMQDKDGIYTHIQFGNPINFDTFIRFVDQGVIICDCGMRSDSPKPYMSWRASKVIWNLLAE